MDLNQRYKIDKDRVAYRIIENEAVMLSLDTGHYYSLNKIGTAIWQMIEKGRNLSDVLNYLKEEYLIEERQLKSDLIELVKDLDNESLIEKST